MASFSSKTLIEGTTRLLTSGKYSDLTITTRTHSFKVHKAIICTHSKVLAAMSDAGFKESSTANLLLEHDDPAAVECMIKFLYTGDYDDNTTDVNSSLMFHVRVYALAEKYDIEGLKRLTEFGVEEIADGQMCQNFPAIVAAVFESTPSSDRGLRDVVSRICANHIDAILIDKTWKETLASNGEIGLAIFTLARQNSVVEVAKATKQAENQQQDLDRAMYLNRFMREGFDQAHEDLERILGDVNDIRERNHECKCCWYEMFERLTIDVDSFKQELPTSLSIHYS